MFKHYFERISEQISIYPLFSLVVFFSFFLIVGLWAFTAKKSWLDDMANMPVQSEDTPHSL